ncbi:MAG TPA: hypothetical protein DHW78_00645 [Ruminococcaceae bacterium]|nr:hypothetical protein [Oscillospiraceae bacterium]
MQTNNFCFLPGSVAQDKNLSLKAKGLYSLIKSCMADPEFDSTYFKSAVMAKCKEKDKAFDNTWKELKAAGYLKQRRIPCSKGKGFHYEYHLSDTAEGAVSPVTSAGRTAYGK